MAALGARSDGTLKIKNCQEIECLTMYISVASVECQTVAVLILNALWLKRVFPVPKIRMCLHTPEGSGINGCGKLITAFSP